MDSPSHARILGHQAGWTLESTDHSWFVFQDQRQHWVQFVPPDVSPQHGSFQQVTLLQGLSQVGTFGFTVAGPPR